ncbi:MAG TPA: histidine kinase N-terminal domain-containing protein [Anaerolineae bacterium]|nr:histidine kinase N-terminal domain-containing protein [Anaerolineae bacterium]HMR63901.1 histidine kinase N-terminal domain-containing protein [Anaerolineae bacterium]
MAESSTVVDESRDKQDRLSESAEAFLQTIISQMGIVADLSRADILIYRRKSEAEFLVVSHAQPHSLAHVYNKSRAGSTIPVRQRPEILQTLISNQRYTDQRSFIAEGAPVVRHTFPIHFPPNFAHQGTWANNNHGQSKVVAALIIVTNLIEYERHRLRSKVYHRALKILQSMLLAGQVSGAEDIGHFGEQDGILYVDNAGIIRYASGIAANLYRKIGYKETLVGRPLVTLDTDDEDLRQEALARSRCLQREMREGNRYWVRKALPLYWYPASRWSVLNFFNRSQFGKPTGVLILVHDDTEIRRQDEEMRVKNAMIQEVHHRVKNNLQTIAGLLRMQARRVKSDEARAVLDETLNRILSVAVIHEFLSSDDTNIINIKEVGNRIVGQLQYGMISPEKQIRIELVGEAIYLPARQATSCALIINELVQNSIEHGFEHKQAGIIRVNLEDDGDEVMITVADNGDGVPDDFKLEQSDSLGLNIIRILVEGDLKGRIELSKGLDDIGLSIKIIFSKAIFGGEAGWKGHVSS